MADSRPLGRACTVGMDETVRRSTVEHPRVGNRRVVFRFEDNEAVDVDLVDYH
ncbi:MAG: hypothetical protein OXU81_04510 [Gammaproteobacteria bacterium]|nr:hypothetical protein [Gammaproteobacteria bacterium]